MDIGAVREFITHLWEMYQKVTVIVQKSRIIDAIELTLGRHRKSAIRLLSGAKRPELRRGGGNRKTKYSKEDEDWLVRVWKTMGKKSSEPFVTELADWIPALKLKLGLPHRVAEKLAQMSASSMDRKLASFRKQELRRRHSVTTPSL